MEFNGQIIKIEVEAKQNKYFERIISNEYEMDVAYRKKKCNADYFIMWNHNFDTAILCRMRDITKEENKVWKYCRQNGQGKVKEPFFRLPRNHILSIYHLEGDTIKIIDV